MTYTELDNHFKQLTKNEARFLSEEGMEKNERGAYIFISQNTHQSVNLELFLHSYKEWLIENKILIER